jgi:hypothetical protein
MTHWIRTSWGKPKGYQLQGNPSRLAIWKTLTGWEIVQPTCFVDCVTGKTRWEVVASYVTLKRAKAEAEKLFNSSAKLIMGENEKR